jgi:uncharacterized protein YuzE
MRYFYDREADSLSLTLSEVFDWSGSEELSGGAITMHLDRRGRPFAVEIRGASQIVSTSGLQLMHETAITHDEISRRMAWSDAGRQAWSTIVRRMLVPHYGPGRQARATA